MSNLLWNVNPHDNYNHLHQHHQWAHIPKLAGLTSPKDKLILTGYQVTYIHSTPAWYFSPSQFPWDLEIK